MIWSKDSFPDKVREDEDIILLIRQDIALLGLKFLSLFLVFFVLLIVRTVLAAVIDNVAFLAAYDTFIFSVNVILISIFTMTFHDYYLSLQIVTSERVIDIDQKGLFNREVNQLSLDKVQDVTYKQNSFLSVVFNFGNVIIETAGSNGVGNSETEDTMNGFVFNNVPNPKIVANLISKLYQNNQEEQKKEAAFYNAQYIQRAMQKDPQSDLNQLRTKSK